MNTTTTPVIAYTVRSLLTGGFDACATVDGRFTLCTPGTLATEADAHRDGERMVKRLRREYA